MQSLIVVVLGNVFLLAALLVLQVVVRISNAGLKYALGNFDAYKHEGAFADRLLRVKNNQIETLALIVPTTLAAANAHLSHPFLSVAASSFLFARLAYSGIALAGIPVLRSVTWSVGFAAWAYIAWITLQAIAIA